MKACAAAYPDRVGPAIFRNNDWTVQIDANIFYCAGGRLLPESLVAQAEKFDPQPFYRYPAKLPPLVQAGSDTEKRVKEAVQRRISKPSVFGAGYSSKRKAR